MISHRSTSNTRAAISVDITASTEREASSAVVGIGVIAL